MGRGTCRFGPAAPDERIVHGACRPADGPPGTPNEDVDGWLSFVRDRGIERVCCLLTRRQLVRYDDLIGAYEATFGPGAVRHAPVTDHRFVDLATLEEDIVPFLRDADAAGEPVVVHCWAGIGRTGHVLALWLARERGYDLDDAIETVRRTGRDPLEAADGREADGRERLRRLL
ncbi:MAG: dual specificity protein phosphatase family protein [Haloferacaceae archaeon]